MTIKNYTSTVPYERSIANIERCLAESGANKIMKDYVGGQCSEIKFSMPINGVEVVFKIPARVGECYKVLESNLGPRARAETKEKLKDQSLRTAWKIVSDWIECQMSMIRLQQIEPLQVFLPYAYDGGSNQTFYEKACDKGINNLLGS